MTTWWRPSAPTTRSRTVASSSTATTTKPRKDFGDGKGAPPIEHFAKGLDKLILRLRDKVCANPDNRMTPEDFRVHLVAHSMGGLVCRAFLQNTKLGSVEARGAVDKLFTYATPHNGIDMRIVRNVPGWLSFGDVNNFNREKMAAYLDVPKGDDVSVVKNFPPERIFNLVGTNPRDYNVAGGISAWAAGEASDGLVRIDNATTHGPGPDGKDVGSPRAFVHRSHSGHYGIVNSEEGYQNLTRFLFGALRVDGILDIDDITLPVEVQKAHERRQDRARVVPVRNSGQRARLPMANDAPRGTRELRHLPQLQRSVPGPGRHPAPARPQPRARICSPCFSIRARASRLPSQSASRLM